MRTRTFVYLAFFLLSVYALTFSSDYSSSYIGEGGQKIVELNVLSEFGSISGNPLGYYRAVKDSSGEYNTWHEFGQILFVLPFFLLFKPLQMTGYPFFISNAILTALAAVLLMKILLAIGFNRSAACLTALLYGVGTIAWFYAAKGTFKQPAAVFLLLGEFYYVLKYVLNKSRGKRNLLIAAVFMGFGIVTKTDLALSAIPLAVLLWQGLRYQPDAQQKTIGRKGLLKMAGAFFLILAPFIVFYLYYDYVRFGTIFKNGYYYSSDIRLKYFPLGASGFLFSPGKSVFLYCPALAVSMLSLRSFFRKVQPFVFFAFVLTVIMYFLIYSAWIDWHGDFCWGPRYLLLIMPFLMMPVASVFERWRGLSRWTKAIVLAVLAVSVLVQVLPAVSNYYLSIAMKYGCGTLADAGATLGPPGSVSNWKSFFHIKESALFNQVGIFYDTAKIFLNNQNALAVMLKLKSRWPSGIFSCIVKDFNFYTPDLWWIQAASMKAYLWAELIFVIGSLSLYGLVREIWPDKP